MALGRARVCVSVSICKTEEENHREIKGPLVESRRGESVCAIFYSAMLRFTQLSFFLHPQCRHGRLKTWHQTQIHVCLTL